MMQLAILGALLFTVILTACGDSADSTTRYEVAVLFNYLRHTGGLDGDQ